MKLLLDTNICVALLKGDASVSRRLVAHPLSDAFLCSVVKGELLFGARNSRRVSENLAKLVRFFAPMSSLPFDDTAAEHYGIVRAQLARAGTPIGPADMMIAAIALAADAVVVTRNADEFRRVPGLRVEAW